MKQYILMFDLMLYIPDNNFSVILGQYPVFLGSDGHCENSIPTTNKVCGGGINFVGLEVTCHETI